MSDRGYETAQLGLKELKNICYQSGLTGKIEQTLNMVEAF